MKKNSKLALVLSIITIVLSLTACNQGGEVGDIDARISDVEQSVVELQARVEAEAKARNDELNTQEKLLEAKGEMLQAQIELQINQNYEKAVQAMESAKDKLEEASATSAEAVQDSINQLIADIDILEQQVQDKASEANNELQILLDEWEVRLSGSGE
jgi:Skp family chaperone for outer membrane proteins